MRLKVKQAKTIHFYPEPEVLYLFMSTGPGALYVIIHCARPLSFFLHSASTNTTQRNSHSGAHTIPMMTFFIFCRNRLSV